MINNFSYLMHLFTRIILVSVLLVLAACERDGAVTSEPVPGLNEPDKFAQYFNQLPSLAASEYRVVATTLNVGESGTYTLMITKDDGESMQRSASWSNSAGAMTPFAIGSYDATQVYDFSLNAAGGIHITLESAEANPFIYLLDRNNNILFDSATAYPGVGLAGAGVNKIEIKLPRSITDSVDYAKAYYQAIDVNNEKDTLYKWRLANCFSNDPGEDFDADVRVVFRDIKDLGYGRNMYWKFGCDGNAGEDAQPGAVAVFVENFNVELVAGFPYTTLNLDAVIANDRSYHFGTNAIEFNNWRSGVNGGEKFNKFYTFRPVSDAIDADETRINMVDLDLRGAKAMPIPCIYCHGGNALPLQANGEFYREPFTGIVGNTDAKLQLLDINTLEFTEQGEFTLEQQQAALKTVNKAVYCSYPNSSESLFCSRESGFNVDFAATSASDTGDWTGDFLREVVQGWYATDSLSKEFPAQQYDGNYVPSGWDPNNIANAGNPASIDRLYLEVIKPTCMVCHSRQGNALGTDSNLTGDGKDIDLSSYDKFLSYAESIEELVYDRGRMPLSLLGFEKFWETDQPTILASFIPNFSHYSENGDVIKPSRPYADAGPDRQINAPAHISGEGSVLAGSYLWEIIEQPASADASLSKADSPRVLFETDVEGLYTLRLTASQGDITDTDTVEILHLNSLPEAMSLTFESDVDPLIGAAGTLGCDICHNDTSATAGIQGLQAGVPEVWDGSGDQSAYRAVMSRVYLNDPANSLILRKSLGEHHYGGTIINRSTLAGELQFNTMLSWIIEGAVEK